ncbi:MAG: DUF1667 domain-containing protein [Clostridiaceae bacterium]|jgi:CxxC motif-containing protein|nr:DUF1667 domain-containing protein [Clostridiaceae bacterium]
MSKNTELTCIVCPLGCKLSVLQGEDDSIIEISGHSCKRGLSYAQTECINPERVITTTVRIRGGQMPLVSVKTDKPIPKTLMMKCMKIINRIEVMVPVKVGDTILENILETGANLVATGNAT